MKTILKSLKFRQVPKKETSLEDIENFLKDEGTKRIHFSTTHTNSLKQANQTQHGKIIVPFNHTINPILSHKFEEGLKQYLFPSNYGGFWRGFQSKKEYELFKSFVEEYNQIVFLRDTLDLSLALSMNICDDDNHTEIGELEYQAKFQNNKKAEEKLRNLVKEWLQKLPYYAIADAICAMPCSNPNIPSLPRRIVDRIDGFENISTSVQWNKKDKSLKELNTVEEKLEALKGFDLEINSDLKGKNVILLDDLYMSGVTMQFVALKMKEAGADRVFGMSIVKSRSNTAR